MSEQERFAMDDHAQVAEALSSIRQAALDIRQRLWDVYGRQAGARAMEIVRQIDQLRSELDDRLCREHPGDDAVLRVYYPCDESPPRQRRCQMTPERQRELRALRAEVKAIRAILERQRVRSILLEDETDSEVPYGD